MSPGRVLAEHSSRELSDWMAYDIAVGLGRDEDQRVGILAAALWNAQGGIPVAEGGKERRAATPSDFFPSLGGAEPAVSHDNLSDSGDAPLTAGEDEVDGPDPVKNYWAFWGLTQLAVERKAQQLEAGQPPDDPESN